MTLLPFGGWGGVGGTWSAPSPASTSQLPEFSPSSPRRPVYQASPAHYRNTSSTSLLSFPYRGSIREASSLLVRKLARRPQGVKPRDWDGVEIRIHSLVRLARVWGKTGGSSTASATRDAFHHGRE